MTTVVGKDVLEAWVRNGPLAAASECRWWVGPVWKLDGETYVCVEPAGHAMPHRSSDGTWFEECGHPPAVTAS
jgi:hypothetical protein